MPHPTCQDIPAAEKTSPSNIVPPPIAPATADRRAWWSTCIVRDPYRTTM